MDINVIFVFRLEIVLTAINAAALLVVAILLVCQDCSCETAFLCLGLLLLNVVVLFLRMFVRRF